MQPPLRHENSKTRFFFVLAGCFVLKTFQCCTLCAPLDALCALLFDVDSNSVFQVDARMSAACTVIYV